MSKESDLEKKITELTNKLREERPSLYEHITENAVTLPDKNSSDFTEALEKYKTYLEDLLKQ